MILLLYVFHLMIRCKAHKCERNNGFTIYIQEYIYVLRKCCSECAVGLLMHTLARDHQTTNDKNKFPVCVFFRNVQLLLLLLFFDIYAISCQLCSRGNNS